MAKADEAEGILFILFLGLFCIASAALTLWGEKGLAIVGGLFGLLLIGIVIRWIFGDSK